MKKKLEENEVHASKFLCIQNACPQVNHVKISTQRKHLQLELTSFSFIISFTEIEAMSTNKNYEYLHIYASTND